MLWHWLLSLTSILPIFICSDISKTTMQTRTTTGWQERYPACKNLLQQYKRLSGIKWYFLNTTQEVISYPFRVLIDTTHMACRLQSRVYKRVECPPSVCMSAPSINTSSIGMWRVCCWAPHGQDINPYPLAGTHFLPVEGMRLRWLEWLVTYQV